MAMTNAMIVLEQALALAEAGKIGYTGEIMTVEINGEEVELRSRLFICQSCVESELPSEPLG